MSTYTVTTSSELMENYLQTDFLDPQDRFLALQTDTGASLLFSIGSGGALNLTMETPGIRHGWQLVDLSSARASQDFTGATRCKTFAASQANGAPAHITMAMVINDGTNDHLYLSIGNSDSDLSWAKSPAWTACPFNAADASGAPITPPSPLLIAGVFVSEASDGEYIVVDIVRNPTEPAGVLSRFYIDVTSPASPVWKRHELAADIQAAGYDSCLGRTAGAFGVDGIYTKGTIGPSAQLIYTPLYNAFDPTAPPLPSRLNLPGGLAADAIAASRNADNTSDLYVAASGGLYYFQSTNQRDGATGELLVTSDMLSGVRSLYAYTTGGNVTVWGLNGNDSVFYLTCAAAQLRTPGAWNTPLPILTGVDAISPYIDRAYNANTFFAHGGDGLLKLVKTPATGMWSHRKVTLPPGTTTQPPAVISSYTTHVEVRDENGQAAAQVPVSLTATSVTSVYINHLYYVVGPQPVSVLTDDMGTITIVETATSLAGTRFNAAVAQQPALHINTMDSAFQRNASYDSSDKLRAAVITNRDGSTQPFIPAGTSDDTLSKVATSNQKLATAYASAASAPPPFSMRRAMISSLATPNAALADAGFLDIIPADLGDLFNWIGSGIDSVIDIVEDAASGVWHFVATIAGQVYSAILDTVEAVVAAVTWIYNAIKIAIELIILFLEFLFGFGDILVTHRVLKNVLQTLAQQTIDSLQSSRGEVDSLFTSLQNEISKWANIPPLTPTAGGTGSANPPLPGQATAPANLPMHHYQGNAGNVTTAFPMPDQTESILQELIDVLSREESTLLAACDAIRTQIIEPFSSLSVSDVIQRLLAILADTLLQSAENVIDAALDVLAKLTAGLIDVLNATIDIPVLSWLYKLLTGDDLTFLDLACLIAAFPINFVYQAGSGGSVPFHRGDAFTEGLLSAGNFSDVRALFFKSSAPQRFAAAEDADPILDEDKLKVFGMVAGVAALAGSGILVYTSVVQKTLDLIGQAAPKTLATLACVGNILYVSPNISTFINAAADNWYAQLNNVLTGISIVKGMAAIPLVNSQNTWVQKGFPAVESFINIVWNVPVIANIVTNYSGWDSSYKSLIPESIGNFAFNAGGILEWPITSGNLELAVIQAGLMLTYGSMMVVAGGIYEWDAGQSH